MKTGKIFLLVCSFVVLLLFGGCFSSIGIGVLDQPEGGLLIIDFPHYEIHEGHSYVCTHNDTLDITDTLSLLVIVTILIHIL